MKIRTSRLFPYPVLWFVTDDYLQSDIRMTLTTDVTPHEVVFHCDLLLENPEMISRIAAGDMQYCVHVECSLTMFRQVFLTKETHLEIAIPAEHLNGRVEIQPLVVALKDIPEYRNSYLHPDYQEAVLVKRGSILAVSDHQYVMVEKSKNDLGIKESIFSFVKNVSNEPMKVETSGDKILIILSEKDFTQLQLLQASGRYQPVVFSLFIIPALIYAFESLDDNLELMREKLWFRSLEKIFGSYKLELTPDTIAQKTSYALAQMVLNHPIGKALAVLTESDGE